MGMGDGGRGTGTGEGPQYWPLRIWSSLDKPGGRGGVTRAKMSLPRRGWCSPSPQMSLEARPQSEPLACGHRKQLVLIVIE